jgi:hypothetical protein
MNDKLKDLFKSVDPKILTEDVEAKLNGVFEAAVTAQVATLKEEIEEKLIEETKNELSEFKENLINKLDEYTKLVCEDYLNENADELESVMKVQLLENLVKGIAGVFKDAGLQLPKGGKNLAEELETKVNELKEEVNDLVEENLTLKEEAQRQAGLRVWAESTKDMPLDQQEKLKKLMEDVEFEDAESLREKIKIMSESFLNTDEKDEDESHVITEDDKSFLSGDESKFASKMAKVLV